MNSGVQKVRPVLGIPKWRKLRGSYRHYQSSDAILCLQSLGSAEEALAVMSGRGEVVGPSQLREQTVIGFYCVSEL